MKLACRATNSLIRPLTGRQQFYIDHDWFLQEDEDLPIAPCADGCRTHPLRLLMGHARHGIHSMWRDDSLLLSLQRGEPDIYVNPDDAAARGVSDGDLIRIFNTATAISSRWHMLLRPCSRA